VFHGTTSGSSVPANPAYSQSPASISPPLPSHQEFFDQFFSTLSSTIASTIRRPSASSPPTPAPAVSVPSPAPPIVPTPAPVSDPVLTPDSAEVHLARLETELAELQKAMVPEPKPDPTHVRIAKLERKLEELCKPPGPSPVASSSVQSPPPVPHVINQTSSAFTVQESRVPEAPQRVEKPRLQAAEITEQVRQTPSYMLARGELAPRASTFMITEQSRILDDILRLAKPASRTSQAPATIPAHCRHFRRQYENHHAPDIFAFHSCFVPASCRPDSGKDPPFL
jgi:hypothetical protein